MNNFFVYLTIGVLQVCVLLCLLTGTPPKFQKKPYEDAVVVGYVPLGPTWNLVMVNYKTGGSHALYFVDRNTPASVGQKVLCVTAGEVKLHWLIHYLWR